LNLRMRVCYLDCHEAGLWCYLVIHIESPLRPIQLFYLYLWPIYWLSYILTGWMPNVFLFKDKKLFLPTKLNESANSVSRTGLVRSWVLVCWDVPLKTADS
jgi:hypothetical protein